MPTDNVQAEMEAWRGGGAFTSLNDRYKRNWQQLDQQFTQAWQGKYKEVADYIALGRGRFIAMGEQPNIKANAASKVINNTATDAMHMLGAGLHGGLSSPARPWFQLKFVDPAMNKFKAYRNWMDDCEGVMYSAFKRSNFYTVAHGTYEEIGAFGTGVMFMDEDPRIDFLFTPLTAGDYRFSIRSDQRTHVFYRRFKMQACQMETDFGYENLSDKVKNVLKSNPYDWREVVHVIEPDLNYDPNVIGSFPFRSIYFEWGDSEKRLKDSGYLEIPVVTPRWQALSNEAYGFGPGLEALGLVKSLQRMEKQSFLASDKALDPPMGMPSSMKDRMLDLSPGGRNVFDEAADRRPYPLYQVDFRALEFYGNRIQVIEDKIRKMFFNEIFLMIANANQTMTATEVVARNEEKMLMLGPTVERLEYEFLDPIVERAFSILARSGKLPPPPAELQNVEYKVEYVSILAQAQKLINTNSMQTYLGLATQVAAVDPSSVIKTNWDQYLEEAGDMVSLPSKVIRSDEDVQEIRDAQAQAQAQAQEMAMKSQSIQNVNTLGNTPTKDGSNALADIEEGMGEA